MNKHVIRPLMILGFLTVFSLALTLPATAFTAGEQDAILASRGQVEFELPERNGMTGNLAARSRSLSALISYFEGGNDYAVLTNFIQKFQVPEAGQATTLREGEEACGPARFFGETLFRDAQTVRDCPFYLYDPETCEYSLGGLLPAGISLEALVRRTDGTVAAMRPNGTVAFVEERFLLILAPRPAKVFPTCPELPKAPFQYRKFREGQALLYTVEADLGQVPLAAPVSPYYDALNPGPERTMVVEQLARRAGGKVAINASFFNMDPNSQIYGFPVGSFINGGKLAYNLTSPQLLAKNRSYAAYTDQGRLLFGESTLSGEEILRRNQDGSFDPQLFGNEKIRSFSSGYGVLVRNRDPQAWQAFAGKQFDPSFYSRNSRRARSLLAVDAGRRRVMFLAEEEGAASPSPMSMPELAEYLVARTAYTDVLFLDGGGSTQLVVDGKTVTSPMDGSSYRRVSSALVLYP